MCAIHIGNAFHENCVMYYVTEWYRDEICIYEWRNTCFMAPRQEVRSVRQTHTHTYWDFAVGEAMRVRAWASCASRKDSI